MCQPVISSKYVQWTQQAAESLKHILYAFLENSTQPQKINVLSLCVYKKAGMWYTKFMMHVRLGHLGLNHCVGAPSALRGVQQHTCAPHWIPAALPSCDNQNCRRHAHMSLTSVRGESSCTFSTLISFFKRGDTSNIWSGEYYWVPALFFVLFFLFRKDLRGPRHWKYSGNSPNAIQNKNGNTTYKNTQKAAKAVLKKQL